MSDPYRAPLRLPKNAPRASWWRRNVVAWWHSTTRRLRARRDSRERSLHIRDCAELDCSACDYFFREVR